MQIIKLVFSVFLFLYASTSMADVVSSKGKASVKYMEPMATLATKDKALFNAQMKAIETFYAEAGDAAAENFDTLRAQIQADPDHFILESTVLAEEDRPDIHQYTVTVRVSLNGSNLRNALKKVSVTGSAPAGERSQLVFVFVSRQVDTQTTFDNRVTKRAIVSDKGAANGAVAKTGTESESVGKSKVSTSETTQASGTYSAERAVTVETGGSSVARTGTTTWRLLPSQNFSQVVTQIFKTSGYRVVEAQYVEPLTNGKLNVATIESDYTSGNDLKSTTLQNVVTGLRTAKVRYFALGTLDVGTATVDAATGLQRVVVTVNAKVIDAGQGIPESVAVAGPTQYSGLGPSEDEARTNALKLAAQSATRELTSQLATAGLL